MLTRPLPDELLLRSVARRSGVSRVADLTGLDFLGIPVVGVVRPASLSLTVAGGKGRDLPAAIASGVMEAFEHHAAETVDPPLEALTCAEAARTPGFADPAALPRDRRARGMAPGIVRWVRAERLAGGPLHVPLDLVHLRLTPAAIAGGAGFLVSTNGLASGTDRPSAILHALCEVIERDAISLALAGPRTLALERLPRIATASVAASDPVLADLLARVDHAGLAAEFRDLTTDLGVAAIYCRLSETARAPHRLARPCDGAGCSADPAAAALRALTEAVQSRLTLVSGARDDVLRRNYAPPAAVRTRDEDGPPPRRLGDLPAAPPGDAAATLGWVCGRLAEAGYPDAAAVDVGAVDLGAVGGAVAVRVVVPGLEGACLSPGYTPGRRAAARAAHRRPAP